MSTSRLTYLDAAKGIGMLLIVSAHTGVDNPIPMLSNVKVALFFLISGLFFITKSSLSFKDYIKGDIQRILTPFIFFYILSYLLFYVGKAFIPGFTEMTGAKGIMDCFTQKQYFNGPIWFLVCLFWTRFFCYIIDRSIDRFIIKVVVVLIVGLLGFSLGKYEIDLPLSIDTALTFTPVLYAGMIIKRLSLLERYTSVESGVFATVLYMSCIPVAMSISDSFNRYGGGSLPDLL